MLQKNKIRILLVSPFPPAMGGISVSSSRLMSRLVADGYEVDTYNLQKKGWKHCHYLWLLFSTLFMPFYVLFKKKYDIIHLHISSYWRRIYLKMVYPLFKGAKTVVTIHGDVLNYMRRPFASSIMDVGDHIICVRPGDSKNLPEKVQHRASEIPAFIMPTKSEILNMELPLGINSFVEKTCKNNIPLLVFNGSIVFKGQYNDLYGFEDIVNVYESLSKKGIEVALLLIVNDLFLNREQEYFLETLRNRLAIYENALVVSSVQFQLLTVFDKDNIIYVRPTKTDGDSLSVREAISLGRLVVASSCAPRPRRTICYDMKDGERALLSAVENAIKLLPGRQIFSSTENMDFYDKIIEVYDSLL